MTTQAVDVLPASINIHVASNNNNDEEVKEAYPPVSSPQLERQDAHLEQEDAHANRNGDSATPAKVLEWNVAEYKVKLRKGGGKIILQNVVGRAEAGTFNGILGPSGCGKTSLLNCLALRNSRFTGALRLDGKPLNGTYFPQAGYVYQKELFFPHVTVREHLTFHAINRLSRIRTPDECKARVDRVMEEVNLTKVADQKIGGGEFYIFAGLSGGERKRLNIATELLADPSILLLDEPNSGLDSVMGELVCLLLKTIALRPPQRIVIMSIHSPPPRLYMLFSHVTLLTSKGELAYWGPRGKLLPFLEGLGYRKPSNYNPADFLLELASTKKIAEGKALALAADSLASHEQALSVTVEGPLLVESQSSPCLVAACEQMISQEFPAIPVDKNHKRLLLGVKGARSSGWVSFKTNLWRSWLSQKREYLGFAVGVGMNAGLGLIFGVLYINQLPKDKGRNTAGYLFSLLVCLLIASTIAVCLNFPFDAAILLREYYAGANKPGGYFLGRTLAGVPASLSFMIIGIVPYYMVGLASDAGAFGRFCLVFFIMNFAAQSLGYLASSFSANPLVGLSILPLLTTPMILFSGMLYERNSVPHSMKWIQDLSIMNYGFALLVINDVEHANPQTRNFLLNFLQVKESDYSHFMVKLVVLSVFYRLAAMAVLCMRVKYMAKAQ